MKKNKVKLTRQDTLMLEHLLTHTMPQHIRDIELLDSSVHTTIQQMQARKNLNAISAELESIQDSILLAFDRLRTLTVDVGATLAKEYGRRGLFEEVEPEAKGETMNFNISGNDAGDKTKDNNNAKDN